MFAVSAHWSSGKSKSYRNESSHGKCTLIQKITKVCFRCAKWVCNMKNNAQKYVKWMKWISVKAEAGQILTAYGIWQQQLQGVEADVSEQRSARGAVVSEKKIKTEKLLRQRLNVCYSNGNLEVKVQGFVLSLQISEEIHQRRQSSATARTTIRIRKALTTIATAI